MCQYPHEGNTSTRRKWVPAGNGGAYGMRGTSVVRNGGNGNCYSHLSSQHCAGGACQKDQLDHHVFPRQLLGLLKICETNGVAAPLSPEAMPSPRLRPVALHRLQVCCKLSCETLNLTTHEIEGIFRAWLSGGHALVPQHILGLKNDFCGTLPGGFKTPQSGKVTTIAASDSLELGAQPFLKSHHPFEVFDIPNHFRGDRRDVLV